MLHIGRGEKALLASRSYVQQSRGYQVAISCVQTCVMCDKEQLTSGISLELDCNGESLLGPIYIYFLKYRTFGLPFVLFPLIWRPNNPKLTLGISF